MLPELLSMTVAPGRMFPASMACRRMRNAARTLMLPLGLKLSSFAKTRNGTPGRARVSRTSGVLPMVESIPSRATDSRGWRTSRSRRPEASTTSGRGPETGRGLACPLSHFRDARMARPYVWSAAGVRREAKGRRARGQQEPRPDELRQVRLEELHVDGRTDDPRSGEGLESVPAVDTHNA